MNLKGLVEKVVEITDPLFEKIKGGYLAFAVAIIGIITLAISSALYTSACIPPFEQFSIFSHWVSNLGGAWTNLGLSPNGSNVVFSVGMIVLSIIAVPAVIYLLKIVLQGYQRFEILIPGAAASGIACFVGIIGLAIFDMKTSILFHVVFSTIFFVGGILMIFLFSLIFLYDAEISKIYGISGVLMAGVGLIFMLSLVPLILQGGNIVLLIVSTSPGLAFTRFWEWMYVFSVFAWFIKIGILVLTRED